MSGLIKQRQNLHQQLRENEDRITNLEQQIQATQKLATLGTMACLVAHEFNNILTPMINYAELALKNQEDVGLMRKALEKTIQHGNRASLVIQSMLGLVRDQTQIKNWIRDQRVTFHLKKADFAESQTWSQFPLDINAGEQFLAAQIRHHERTNCPCTARGEKYQVLH